MHGPGVSAFMNLGFGEGAAEATIIAHEGEERYSLAAAGAEKTGRLVFDSRELCGSDEFFKYYGYYYEDRHFIDCIRNGDTPETGIAEAVKSMKLLEQFARNAI
jgi:predicted dehydrogenase